MQNSHTDQRQPPFECQHDRQYCRCLDGLGDHTDTSAADGILCSHNIVVEAAHELANLGVDTAAQRHTLQTSIECQAQIIRHALAIARIYAPLCDIECTRQGWDQKQCHGQEDEPM